MGIHVGGQDSFFTSLWVERRGWEMAAILVKRLTIHAYHGQSTNTPPRVDWYAADCWSQHNGWVVGGALTDILAKGQLTVATNGLILKIKRSHLNGRILKDLTLLNITPSKTKIGQSTFKCDAAREWNGLSRENRELNTLSKSKTHIFKHSMDQDRINHVCAVN